LKINFYLNRIQYKFILICFLSIVTLDAEEISAFGAGDLSSPNPYGLTSAEESILNNTGDPVVSNSQTSIVNNSLELSNADLSISLTNLIVYQRSFEANSKTVTTSDEFLKTAIGLKR